VKTVIHRALLVHFGPHSTPCFKLLELNAMDKLPYQPVYPARYRRDSRLGVFWRLLSLISVVRRRADKLDENDKPSRHACGEVFGKLTAKKLIAASQPMAKSWSPSRRASQRRLGSRWIHLVYDAVDCHRSRRRRSRRWRRLCLDLCQCGSWLCLRLKLNRRQGHIARVV
jgi:hypothetical protein